MATLTYKFVNLIVSPVFVDHILCEIEYGQNARSIARTLYEQGIIKNEKLFYILARLKGLDKDLKAGYYLFYGDLNMIDTVQKIFTGEIIVEKVIIPEGSSMYRTLKTLADYEIGDYERLLSLANDRDFIYDLTGFPVDKLEGFLYPDTYIFSYNMQEENVLNVITNNFFKKLNEANVDLTDKDRLYKDIILASIVEKEVIFNDEKPVVSSVYNNRIKKGMRLQADPTVTYYLEPDFIHKRRLTYKDTRYKSPHNTYVINGLPPTPICSPSITSIIAAQNPDSTNYYFFFANRYGRHIFSETYSQHLRKQRSRRY
ncbi:MAG: endolytic transglycosylase MltG [Candidatus Cloacimonetes bacterium]|nr:endolytic transglycosylase MltG [Candidatus Cloacimonadota bacterium]